MSPKDTIPPERIDARLVALSVQVEGLSRIVLALEGRSEEHTSELQSH